MADNNLTVQIGGDSSKLRADLKFTQTALKDLDRQISAAFKSGDTARARDLSNTFGKMKDEAVNLERSLRGVGATGSRAFNEITQAATRADASVNVTARSTSRLFKQLQSVPRAFGIGGTLLGGGIGGAAGAAVGIGISKLIDQFGELAKTMREIRDLSRETGAKPLMVQGMQELAKEASETEDAANKFLTGVSRTLAKVATETADDTKATTQNFAIFGDKTVQVMRGAEKATLDFSDSLSILQINREQLKKQEWAKGVQTLGEAFLRTEKNAKQLGLNEIQLNEISKDVFGVPRAGLDALLAAFTRLDEKQKELAASARGATAANFAAVDEVAKAQEKLSQQTKESGSAIAKNVAPAWAAFLRGMTDALKNLPETLQQSLTAPAGPTFTKPITDEANKLPPFFTDLMSKIGKIFQDTPKEFVFPLDPIKEEANKLPSFFEGLTNTLDDIWSRFWKGLSMEAKAATLDVQGGMAAIKASADQATASVKQMGAVGGDYGGGGDTAGGGASSVSVKRGPGTGPTGGYGPASFNQSTGYGPGSFPTQSILPGVSDYQALPPHMVSPMATSSYGSQAAKSAAEASADAAYAARSAAEASATAVKAWVDPGVKFASGGMVRGPGTATSDSILARLSAGEFVMRAAAVNRVGAGFLSRLNGFADGGMVMPSRSIPSFASGGLVSGGVGGATVNLVFPGGSFELRADSETVGALTREARRAGMLNAGRLPGAFA